MPRRQERVITKRVVDALSVEGKDAVFWDRDLPGAGIRVYPSGRKVYVVQSRGPGGSKRVTVPHELNRLAQRQPALIYRLLFKAASQTLLEFGHNPRWLGGELGITMVLHTWGQNLSQHVHVHCIVTDWALSPDRKQWLTPPRRGFLFPTTALSKVFRGKYVDFLSSAHRSGELRMPDADGVDDNRVFESLKASLQSHDWVVYTKAPFAECS